LAVSVVDDLADFVALGIGDQTGRAKVVARKETALPFRENAAALYRIYCFTPLAYAEIPQSKTPVLLGLA
jgi:hypothetical protein